MPFGKEDAYFLANLLAGQLPIGRGAAWLAKRAWRAILHQNAQRDRAQSDEEAQSGEQAALRSAFERLQQNDVKLNDKLSAILEPPRLQVVRRVSAARPECGPSILWERNHDYHHHSTRRSLVEHWRLPDRS